MPSTQNTFHNFLFENIVVQYDNKQVRINLYDTPLGKRFIEALKDNLDKKRILKELKSGKEITGVQLKKSNYVRGIK